MARRPFIVVIGPIDTDVVLPSPPGAAGTIAGGDVTVRPGGSGANRAVAAARLGADVAMVGRVGDDLPGVGLRDDLRAHRVDVRHVRRSPGVSGAAVVLPRPGGDGSVVRSPGANAELTPADVAAAAALLRRADGVLLQRQTPPAAVRHAMRLCRKFGTPVLLDPAPVPPGRCPPWVLAADVVCTSAAGAAALLGLKSLASPDAMAAALVAAGATDVVLTLGPAGSLHADATGVFTHVPAMEVEVVDPAAAGDAFTAALTVARAGGATWADALRFANAAGALACTKAGAQPSLPRRADVCRLLRRMD